MRRWSLIALLFASCGPSRPQETSLVDHMRWIQMEAAADPFPDRPAGAQCGLGGARVEDGVFEIETDACAYLTAEQPLAIELRQGDQIDVLVWHLALIAPEPAEAHLALQVGSHEVVNLKPAIPSPENVVRMTWTVPEDIAAGTQVLLHAHNHGYNSYRFGPMELLLDP